MVTGAHASNPPGARAHTTVVPAATAVTTPVVETVATPAIVLLHVNVAADTVLFDASFAVAVICCVAPTDVSVGPSGATDTVAPRMPRRIFPPSPTSTTSPLPEPQMPRYPAPLPIESVTLQE